MEAATAPVDTLPARKLTEAASTLVEPLPEEQGIWVPLEKVRQIQTFAKIAQEPAPQTQTVEKSVEVPPISFDELVTWLAPELEASAAYRAEARALEAASQSAAASTDTLRTPAAGIAASSTDAPRSPRRPSLPRPRSLALDEP